MTDSLVIELTSKDITKLNEFNQITKRVFNGIYAFTDGVIICDKSTGTKLNKGVHFATFSGYPINGIPEDSFVYFLCDNIFKVIRDNKRKDICSLLIRDKELFIVLRDEKLEKIGHIFKNEISKQKNDTLAFIEYHKENATTLTKDSIEKLCDNEIITYIEDEYKVRLTREVLPALKKDMGVDISFHQNIDPALFDLIISINKSTVTTYHMYRCVKF